MGGLLAKNVIKTKSSFNTTVINTAVNSFRQDAYVAYKNTIAAANNVEVSAEGLKNCNLAINITTNISDYAAMTLNQANLSSVNNTFSTQITNDIAKQFQQQNENFGLGENVAKDATTVSNFIQNTIINTFTESLNSVFVNDIYETNSVRVTLKDIVCQNKDKDGAGQIIINSAVLIENANTIQIDQVLKAVVTNSEINTILNKYNLTITQTNSVSIWVYLSIALIFLSIALLPLIVGIISQKSGAGASGVNLIKILYLTLMLGSAIAGVYVSSQNPLNVIYSALLSLAVILFFLLIFFG